MELKPGIRNTCSLTVTEERTAKAMGSGLLPVFATPCMAALMEQTAFTSVEPFLEPGQGTVGTSLRLEHLAATPVGMTVTCASELVEVDSRRLVFQVTVNDEKGLVGRGTHERFIIYNERFLAKAEARKD